MNRFFVHRSGGKRAQRVSFAPEGCQCREMDDIQMARRMRTLAVEIRVDRWARLTLPKEDVLRLQSLNQEARLMERQCGDPGASLKRLVQDGRMLEACARQARAEGGVRLPSSGREPRILRVTELLSCRGERELSPEALVRRIADFDDVQALTMPELWAVPEALRIVIARRTVEVAHGIVKNALQRKRAEDWVQRPRGDLSGKSPAFFEMALRLASEQELSGVRHILEAHLLRGGKTPAEEIRLAHEQQAAELLALERLMAAKRLVDGMDWQACFEKLSHVERELRYDPSHVYAGMDDASREAVRSQVSRAARKLNLSEITIARHAVNAALDAARSEETRRSTVCYWLMTDEGLRDLAQRMGVDGKPLGRIVPDPGGRRCVAVIILTALALYGLWLLWVDSPWLYLLGIPIVWTAANGIIGRVYARLFPPAKLLSMAVDHVPDGWRTLVVMPVLLSNEARAREICGQMEALGCLEEDKNIRYLLLGDFSDDRQSHCPGDAAIVRAAKEAVEGMNARAGWEKYGYIHRPRTYLKVDRKWMGFDRKRGALMALNRLLMGIPGAEDAFSVEGAACSWLKAGFAFVVTLDADTRCLPGTVRRLIGCAAHPLNRKDGQGHGYGILQPAMEMMPSACINAFVRLFAGSGGLNTYPASISNLWQDLTGEGMFAGKGIYDVKAFYRAMEGTLPEGRILSHDLIEGAIVRAGFVGDISFYDGYPGSLGAVMKRLNRWTRGDWQLLPFIFSKKVLPDGRRFTAAQRLRMIDNLLRSLYAPCLLAVLIAAVWMGSGNALSAAVLSAYWNPIIGIGNGDRLKWRRATAEFALLPVTAWHMMDAVLRTLWRLAVSGKHMLDWVTAADAEHAGESVALPGRIAAILLIPGLLVSGWGAAAAALAALFLVAPGWIRDMERESFEGAESLSREQIAVLNGLARDTWRFFEKYVPEDGTGLPPDNVQLDPPVGIAGRTSPTNIGLYLVSCLAACHMGFIRETEMIGRMAAAMDSMERMDKWRGHLYNWYDIGDLSALMPRYVSAVDSGNLAACLILTAAALEKSPAEGTKDMALRMRRMAWSMDFASLYDKSRELFFIGVDGATGEPGASHYDLLASESRILSYVAIMLGQVDIKHWSKLSRTAVTTESGSALVSWSGTMFEYLMPEIFMRSPAHSLMGRGNRAVVNAQKALARRRMRPWGVSESGYYAFDAHLNYQYRAFGLKALALGGSTVENVVAPYASLLALPVDPAGVAGNVSRMRDMGWMGECGLYEAADYTHMTADGQPRLVRSHMAHHQGMILCALCNALNGNYLVNSFMSVPQARALHLLIQEKPVAGVRLKAPDIPENTGASRRGERSFARTARPDRYVCDAHLLYGGGATACITEDGAVRYMKNGVCGSRFTGEIFGGGDGACLHVYDAVAEEGCIPGQWGRMRYDAGFAECTGDFGGVEIRMKIYLSPEDGALYRDVELVNKGDAAKKLALADVVPVALAPAADVRAHAVFRNLFVESSPLGQRGIVFRRRPRADGEICMQLVHMTSETGPQFETDYEKLTGRMGSTLRAGGIRRPFENSFGTVLNPVSAMEITVELEPGETRRVHFALDLLESDEDGEMWMQDHLAPTSADRALQLAVARARAMLDFIGIDPGRHTLLQRLSAVLLDGRLAAHMRDEHRPCEGTPRNRLWEMGISGDLPIMTLWVDDPGQMGNVRDIIRCHEFYRAMGLAADLVLVNDFGGGYSQPVRDMITERIASSHLSAMRSVPGGAWVLDGQELSETARWTLRRASAVNFRGGRDLYDQMRVLLKALEDGQNRPGRVMDIGAAALNAEHLEMPNGYGGFASDGGYVIDVYPERTTPAPWVNILANDRAGILLTERGGGFAWHENSRSGRLTPFGNDALREGWGLMFYLVNEATDEYLRLLPGLRPHMPFRAYYDGAHVRYRFETEKIAGSVSFCMAGGKPEIRIGVALEDRGLARGSYAIFAFVNWQMGTDNMDSGWISDWNDGRALYASGTSAGAGYFAARDPRTAIGPGCIAFLGRGGIMSPAGFDAPGDSGGYTLRVPVTFPSSGQKRVEFALGWGSDVQDAREQTRRFYGDRENALELARVRWAEAKDRLVIHTPDPALNHMANAFLIHQAMASRIMGRTGFYQPGGAYGFRDQLQDMLAILHTDPDRVRGHILRCAAHQFEDGDVMHWWHEPWLGVRTKITDDMLFLPWVTAAYVNHTQDISILDETVAFLENMQIPEGREDVFMEMRPGRACASLHDHCMRAFRRVARTGEHGLALMGSGDWNDGMNRVGPEGRGESIWLSEFIAACAKAYGAIIADESDRAWLSGLASEMIAAIETHGWDGSWYLRAFTDHGEKLGGAEGMVCRIDAISQAWAVLAGLNPARCGLAMDSAWELLADRNIGIVKLLTPPFDGTAIDPGYIRGYPAGVRENGAQYTHGACWLLLAMIRMGREEQAHEMLRMLLPPNHADTKAAAERYRVEPYVMAADVYSVPPNEGRGGWTWYTGAAAWMYSCILSVLGYERRGDRVRLNALLGDWPEVRVKVKFGAASYTLVCRREFEKTCLDGVPVDGDFIVMCDDGADHEAHFAPRRRETLAAQHSRREKREPSLSR